MSSHLLRSTAVVGGMTAISRVLGFVRDMVIALAFGAAAQLDAYIVAFRIPNLLRRLFAEGAFAQAFVPVLTELRYEAGPEAERKFLDTVTGHLLLWLAGVTLLGWAAAPLLAAVFAPGFIGDSELFSLAVLLVRITLPYIVFISLVALAASILNVHGYFALPAFAPVLLNVMLIVAALAVAPHLAIPVTALGWGVLAGGAAQLACLLLLLLRLGLIPRPRLLFPDAAVRKLWHLMLPSLFGAGISQISLVINSVMASFLTAGSVSWLYYADRLMEFPLGIFSLAIATAVLPSLARAHTGGVAREFTNTVDWSLRLALLITVPAAAALGILSGPLICTLFHYGRFSDHDVIMASHALAAYAPGLVGLSLVKILGPTFFARGDTSTPVRVGLVALVTNIVLNLVLAPFLGHVGLALGTSSAAAINAILLFWTLLQAGSYRPSRESLTVFSKICLATIVMSAILAGTMDDLSSWLLQPLFVRLQHLVVLIALGLTAYFGVLAISGVRWLDMTGRPTAV